jgi:hypothetical protein
MTPINFTAFYFLVFLVVGSRHTRYLGLAKMAIFTIRLGGLRSHELPLKRNPSFGFVLLLKNVLTIY